MAPKIDPDLHDRRSIRLDGYDYSDKGCYFITICTHNRESVFGGIQDDEMRANEYGQVMAECWQWLAAQYAYVDLDEWVVMPNLLHGVLLIEPDNVDQIQRGSRTERRRQATAPTGGERKSLGRLIGAFKTVSTKRVNEMRRTAGAILWQRNYYEHVVRDERDLERIRNYIIKNPVHWAIDHDNPDNSKR